MSIIIIIIIHYCYSLGEAFRPALIKICENIMGHLNQKGFYSMLQVQYKSPFLKN